MSYVGVEYMTAMKDYENIVLEQGLAEIESYRKKAAPIDSMKHYLGRQFHHSFQEKDGNIGLHQECGVKNQDVLADWNSEHFTCDHLEDYLEEHDLVDVMMYMEYNHPEKKIKCYGHPCMLQHNWVTIQVEDCDMLAQCMLFLISWKAR